MHHPLIFRNWVLDVMMLWLVQEDTNSFLFFMHFIILFIKTEFFDLINVISLPQEVRKLLKKNMTFTSSCLEYNPKGGDFILEGKIKKHKMVAPKGNISADTWRTISRGINEIDEICEKAEENFHVLKDDTYRDIDFYDEIAAWQHYCYEYIWRSRGWQIIFGASMLPYINFPR